MIQFGFPGAANKSTPHVSNSSYSHLSSFVSDWNNVNTSSPTFQRKIRNPNIWINRSNAGGQSQPNKKQEKNNNAYRLLALALKQETTSTIEQPTYPEASFSPDQVEKLFLKHSRNFSEETNIQLSSQADQ